MCNKEVRHNLPSPMIKMDFEERQSETVQIKIHKRKNHKLKLFFPLFGILNDYLETGTTFDSVT